MHSASFEDDDIRVYSQRPTGTFAERQPQEGDAYEEKESPSEDDREYEMNSEEINAINHLRSIESKVDYQAIRRTDSYNEGLYQKLNQHDIKLINSLSGFLKSFGVIENLNYSIESDESIDQLFTNASLAATDDKDIDPENYSDESEVALNKMKEHALLEEEMSFNPELDETDEEYEELLDDIDHKSHDISDKLEFLSYNEDEEEDLDWDDEDNWKAYDDEDELDSLIDVDEEDDLLVNYKQETEDLYDEEVDSRESHTFNHMSSDEEINEVWEKEENFEDDEEEQEESYGSRKLSIDDLITIKRMFSLGKLDDNDIVAIFTGISIADVRRLRSELMN